jgi:HSP20 family protein
MVVRFDPFRDLDRLAVRLLDTGAGVRTMPMDLYRAGEHFVLHLDLPGIDPGSLELGVDGRTLTVRAQRTVQDAEHIEWLAQERPMGSFARQFALGDSVDVEHVEATYHDGVLTVILPVAEKALPRRIEVQRVSASPSVSPAGAEQVEISAEPAATARP